METHLGKLGIGLRVSVLLISDQHLLARTILNANLLNLELEWIWVGGTEVGASHSRLVVQARQQYCEHRLWVHLAKHLIHRLHRICRQLKQDSSFGKRRAHREGRASG